MIVFAIATVLVVLVLANIGLKVFNHTYPPCESYEYFEAATMLPDGAALSLSSIPTSINLNYVGAKTVATDMPGVIGLTSRNPPIDQKNNKLFAAMEKMFSNKSHEVAASSSTRTKTASSAYDGVSSAIFEVEMEGLQADSSHRNTNTKTMKPSGFVKTVERDGYSNR